MPSIPSPSSIKCQIRELRGTEVYKFVASDHPDHLHHEKLAPITQRDGLVEGDVILVPALIGKGFFLMTVKADNGGLRAEEAQALRAEADKLVALLRFGEDERNAWVCTGLMNMRGLERLKVTL
jgi:hypothetical protein